MKPAIDASNADTLIFSDTAIAVGWPRHVRGRRGDSYVQGRMVRALVFLRPDDLHPHARVTAI
jgi:hypothetical protein